MQWAAWQWARPTRRCTTFMDVDGAATSRLDKPVYLMGVGTPANILEAVERRCGFFRLRVSQPEMAVMATFIPTMAS